MSEETPDAARWLAGWNAASQRMAQLRRERLDHVDLPRIIESLQDAFESALAQSPPRTTSGLVEQQAWFMKGRR